MKTHYKILPLLWYLLLTVFSIGFSILTFKWFSIDDYSAISIFIFCSFLIMTLISFTGGVLEIKSLEIDNNTLIFRQLFGLYIRKYKFIEIVGINKAKFQNKIGKYSILLIKTTSGRIFEINGFIISNMDKIEKELKKEFIYDKSIVRPMLGTKEKIIIFALVFYILSFIWIIISKSL